MLKTIFNACTPVVSQINCVQIKPSYKMRILSTFIKIKIQSPKFSSLK